MFRFLSVLVLFLVSGCASAPKPRPLASDPDAVIEEVAVEVGDEPVYGELPPADVRSAACFMTGEIIPRERAVTADWGGQKYEFCCDRCRKTFQAQPERYIGLAFHRKDVISAK